MDQQIQMVQLVGHDQAIPRYQEHWAKLYYIEPVYLENGRNGCRIYYDDGFVENIPARLQYVLQKLASQIHISLKALQQQSLQLLESKRKHYVPLVVNEYFILLPVICRQQQRKSDSTYGYVVQQKIAGMTVHPEGGTKLTFLTNPYEIQVQSKVRTLRRYVALGITLQQKYVDTVTARKEAAEGSLMVKQNQAKEKGRRETIAVQQSLWPM